MKVAFLRFLALVFPLLTITAAATFYIYHEDVLQLEQRVMERERNLHQSSLHITRLYFAPIINDLRYLSQKAQELSFTEHISDEKIDILVSTFKRLANTHNYYDQIRLIDASGMKVIRVNLQQGDAVRVKEEQLQNKSHRPYVLNALKIKPGTFYISQFDLKMENGQRQTPPKPMLRFISHLEINGKSWLVSLNYLGKDYLFELHQRYSWHNGQNWLINNKGQWLLGPKADSAWQFTTPRKTQQQNDFNQAYSQLWQQINNNNNGQLRDGDYLSTLEGIFSSNDVT